MGRVKLVMIDMAGQELPAPSHLWELWLALPSPAGKQTVEKTVSPMATEVCLSGKESDVEILTLESYLTKLPDYRPLCSSISADSYQEAFSSQANQVPWPHASGSSAALPRRAAESCSLRRRDGEEQKWETDTWLCKQPSCCWLIPPTVQKPQVLASWFWGPWALGFLFRIPAGPALWSIFFLSHLICWLASKLIKIILSWQADSFLPRLQVLGTGIPAHLPVSIPGLLRVLCC